MIMPRFSRVSKHRCFCPVNRAIIYVFFYAAYWRIFSPIWPESSCYRSWYVIFFLFVLFFWPNLNKIEIPHSQISFKFLFRNYNYFFWKFNGWLERFEIRIFLLIPEGLITALTHVEVIAIFNYYVTSWRSAPERLNSLRLFGWWWGYVFFLLVQFRHCQVLSAISFANDRYLSKKRLDFVFCCPMLDYWKHQQLHVSKLGRFNLIYLLLPNTFCMV